MQSLAPCIIKIAGRSEEAVLETLASALPKILSSLGPFINDNETKVNFPEYLLKRKVLNEQ